MNISPQGLALIRKFEGFSARPYICPAGKWTVGFGHVIPPVLKEMEITEDQAEKLLLQDLAPVEAAINRLVTAPLSQNQFDALCSLGYNIGIGAFAKSTLLKLLNRHREATGRGDPSSGSNTGLPRRSDDLLAMTANEFLRWVYGGGKVLPGLQARRQAEKILFETGC